jgi:hypothetical protein
MLSGLLDAGMLALGHCLQGRRRHENEKHTQLNTAARPACGRQRGLIKVT